MTSEGVFWGMEISVIFVEDFFYLFRLKSIASSVLLSNFGGGFRTSTLAC